MEYKTWKPFQPGEELHDSYVLHSLRCSQKLREQTFENHWRHEYGIHASFLAEKGWIYRGPKSRIFCVFCEAIQSDWKRMDPMRMRYHHRGDCPKFQVGFPKRLAPGTVYCTNSQDPAYYDGYLKHEFREYYGKYEHRLATFETWSRCHGPFSRERMAKCGFIFEFCGDSVMCFYCGGRFGDFDYDNTDIFFEHAEKMPHCEFIKNGIGPVEYNKVPTDPDVVKEMLFCSVCKIREKSMRSDNCTHLVSCTQCQFISHCPICKKRIIKMSTVYLA